MSTCLVVQHVEPESAWLIGDALAHAGVVLDVRRAFAGDLVPADPSGHDGIVVMGGPMSAISDEQFPSRVAELTLLVKALDAGIPTLGICLGAQLLAVAAGGSVSVGSDGPEVGWAPIELNAAREGDQLLSGLPERLTVLHWHGDTFALPEGAHHLARSSRYENQVFRIGEAAWGLQFHMEVTGPAVESFLQAFVEDAGHAAGGAAAIRDQTPTRLANLAPWSTMVFGRFAALVAAGTRAAETTGSLRRFADISEP